MKVLTLDNPHRRRHFEFFAGLNHPHFSVCAQIDVTPWVQTIKQHKLHFTSSIVYLLCHAANSIPQFRQRLRADHIVEHELVHPSFAVATEGTDVFSFCEVEFGWRLQDFLQRAQQQIALRRSTPSFADEEGRDDYLFMSAFPWFTFTAVTHPMQYHPHDSVPRLTWGKIYNSADKLLMPLSVQAHHALVDGIHLGQLLQHVEALAQAPAQVLGDG